jgi:hypothetical protein
VSEAQRWTIGDAHVPDAPGGRVTADGDAWRFTPVAAEG